MFDENRSFLSVIQEDLPIEKRPFLAFAKQLGVTEDDLIHSIIEAKTKGVIRRYGAVVRHVASGFVFNVMIVYDLPADYVATVGQKVAEKEYVSHCYERERYDAWPYNFYAMVHAKNNDEGREYVSELQRIAGDYPCKILKSLKEYKKTSLRIL